MFLTITNRQETSFIKQIFNPSFTPRLGNHYLLKRNRSVAVVVKEIFENKNKKAITQCLIENPKWLKRDSELGLALIKRLGKEDDSTSNQLRNMLIGTYKCDQIFQSLIKAEQCDLLCKLIFYKKIDQFQIILHANRVDSQVLKRVLRYGLSLWKNEEDLQLKKSHYNFIKQILVQGNFQLTPKLLNQLSHLKNKVGDTLLIDAIKKGDAQLTRALLSLRLEETSGTSKLEVVPNNNEQNPFEITFSRRFNSLAYLFVETGHFQLSYIQDLYEQRTSLLKIFKHSGLNQEQKAKIFLQAANLGCVSIVKNFLADDEITDSLKRTALFLVSLHFARSRFEKTFKIIAQSLNYIVSYDSRFEFLTQNHDPLDLTLKGIDGKSIFEEMRIFRRYALHAIFNGRPLTVDIEDINQYDLLGMAIRFEQLEVIKKLLLLEGINVNGVIPQGNLAPLPYLHYAFYQDKWEIFDQLIEHEEININEFHEYTFNGNRMYLSPLTFLALKNFPADSIALKELNISKILSHPAFNPNAKDPKGKSLIFRCLKIQDLREVGVMLLDHPKFDITAKISKEDTLPLLCIEKNKLVFFKTLIEKKLIANDHISGEWSLLERAIYLERLHFINVIIKNKLFTDESLARSFISISLWDNNIIEFGTLYYSTEEKILNISDNVCATIFIFLFLRKKNIPSFIANKVTLSKSLNDENIGKYEIDFNFKDCNGNTIIFYLLKQGNKNIISLLKQQKEKIDWNIRNNEGQTPLLYTLSNNFSLETFELIKNIHKYLPDLFDFTATDNQGEGVIQKIQKSIFENEQKVAMVDWILEQQPQILYDLNVIKIFTPQIFSLDDFQVISTLSFLSKHKPIPPFKLNLDHLEYQYVLEIPEPDPSADEQRLIHLWKKVKLGKNEINDEGRLLAYPIVTKKFEAMLSHIKNETPSGITALPKTPEARKVYYTNLRKMLRHIEWGVSKDISMQKEVMLSLGISSTYCAVRWMQAAENYFNLFLNRQSLSPIEKLFSFLAQERESLFSRFISHATSGQEQNVHLTEAWMIYMGKEVGIAKGQDRALLNDEHAHSYIPTLDKQFAIALFFDYYYNAFRIIQSVKNFYKIKANQQTIYDLMQKACATKLYGSITKKQFEELAEDIANKIKLPEDITKKILMPYVSKALKSILEITLQKELDFPIETKRNLDSSLYSKVFKQVGHQIKVVLSAKVDDAYYELDEDYIPILKGDAIETLLLDLGILETIAKNNLKFKS